MEIAIVYIFAPIENKRLVGAAAWRIGRSGSRLVCSHEITSMTALPSTNGRLYRDSVMAQLQASQETNNDSEGSPATAFED